ncbi:hypothetical protein [Methylobacterium sp. sgz302541]|uniref:hypothetical protein n=1 Tax=unclassified Methylobacterium TaxID=2615210 RepID=UPI003D3289EC
MADDRKTVPPHDRKPAAGTGDKANPENRQDKMSKRLDEALEETFPSSDPVNVKITK